MCDAIDDGGRQTHILRAVSQAFAIERQRIEKKTGKVSTETV